MRITKVAGVVLNQFGCGHRTGILKTVHGYILGTTVVQKSLLDDIINAIDGFDVTMITSSLNWKNWIAVIDIKTCRYCKKMHGKVYDINDMEYEHPPVHEKCRCEVKNMSAIFSGHATREAQNGADYWLN